MAGTYKVTITFDTEVSFAELEETIRKALDRIPLRPFVDYSNLAIEKVD